MEKLTANVEVAKGEDGGICRRTACNNRPAVWWNPHTAAFYCDPCAQKINDALRQDGLQTMWIPK